MPRIAIVRKDRCNPQGCGNYLCIRVCPVNMQGKDCIIAGPDKKALIDEVLCVGCGICPQRCPFEAIDIINLPEALENPIHRYGRNGFHLYSLPTPLFDKVTGIIGKNGIGKTTAVKILGGVQKPNLGTEEEAGFEELVKFFKGTEAQSFFEAIRDGKIKIAYKPQSVDLIPKMFHGTVRELLKKADERGAFDPVVKELELKEVLDTDVCKISGGELQRFAIAATVLRKANLYIFDEPSNYLDIKQRIKVSKFIRGLAKPETSILVVEHDLIILDYMTDLVHIMYGKEGSYGVVSMPKATRQGMNTYLSGYIREENMRFRDYEIKFAVRPPPKLAAKVALTSWTDLTKTLGKFSLNAKAGSIARNDVVGVLGENGIGKTTFAKMLAGVLKPDSGEVDTKIKVAYKPQYLEGSSEELVLNVLADAVEKYEIQLVRPLELKPLLTKQINQLSVGELQRVAIAHCLSQDADLYLLDEPSAYLDVEQRLAFSKIIREVAEQRECSILVVDHDLLFVDYLADKLLVFEGTPAKQGFMGGPYSMTDGMNKFLTGLDITMRRDAESHRPRINKPGSRLDREQKAAGKLYYA